MPTVHPSSHPAESWGKRPQSHSRYTLSTSPEHLLSTITANDGDSPRSRAIPRLVQSSFPHLSQSQSPQTTFAAKNGFVHACLEAYNEHHNLVLRPDDVWLAILTQLSVHVNANAEELRSRFVSHDGQADLHIEVELTPDLDHGAMAYEMTKLMGSAMKDASLRDWILPAFSTTEKNDQAVASVVFMGTMQKYFTYSWGTRCGIPAVRLLGEEDDWFEIAERCAERLGGGAFGEETRGWYRVLKPVLAGLVETFRDPEGDKAKRFWQGIVDEHRPNGSGRVTYSGWITAFCYWDEKGECLHRARAGTGSEGVRLAKNEIPMGFVKVPVTLLDNGVKIPTEMVAGSVGMRVRRWDEKGGGTQGSTAGGGGASSRQRWDGFDTLQPELGWFMQLV